jgi:hypothetical protein
MKVLKATQAPLSFDVVDNIVDRVTPEAISSLRRTGCGLKGEFVTGVGRGTKPSINIDLRKSMQVRHVSAPAHAARLCAPWLGAERPPPAARALRALCSAAPAPTRLTTTLFCV